MSKLGKKRESGSKHNRRKKKRRKDELKGEKNKNKVSKFPPG